MPTQTARTGALERARRLGGADALREELSRMAQKDRRQAVRMLDAPATRFSTLYLLTPVISSLQLFPELGTRDQAALRLCARQNADGQPVSAWGPPAGAIVGSPEQTRAALRWMLDTGLAEDGLDDGFDQLMDTAAALLVITWHDTSMLPQLIPAVFRRHRRGLYIHDLLWVIFRSHDPRALDRVALFLRSPNPKDAELAEKLLRGVLDETDAPAGRPLRYPACRAWLEENRKYLRFTGEGFQQSSEPRLCRVDYGAKYLGRPVSGPEENAALSPEMEARSKEFAAIEADDRRRLARHSRRLRRADRRRWQRWMALPAARQLAGLPGHAGGAS